MNNFIFTHPIDQIYEAKEEKESEDAMTENFSNFNFIFNDLEHEEKTKSENFSINFLKADKGCILKPKLKFKLKPKYRFKYQLKTKWEEKISLMKTNSFLLMKKHITRQVFLIRQYFFTRLCDLVKVQLCLSPTFLMEKREEQIGKDSPVSLRKNLEKIKVESSLRKIDDKIHL